VTSAPTMDRRKAPRPPAVRTVLLVSFIDALGSGIFLAAAPVLAIRGLGHPAPLVGLALGLNGLAALLNSVPLGRLSDRLNPRIMLIAVHLARGLVVAAFGFVTSAWTFVGLLILLGAAEGGVSPLMQALVARYLGADGRVRRMAQVRVARNAGFAGGSLVAAGVMLGAPGPAAVAVGFADAATFLVSAILLSKVPQPAPGHRPPAGSVPPQASRSVSRRAHRARITVVGALSGVVAVHVTVLTIAIPLWITQSAELPPSLAPILITVNAGLVIMMQVRFSDRLKARKRALGLFTMAALPLGASFAVFPLRAGLPIAILLIAAVLAVLAITFAELVHSVAVWDVGFALSSEQERAGDLARFNLGSLGQEIVAPIILTIFLSVSSPYPWILLGLTVAISGLVADRLVGRARGYDG
jgi:MFS family permease